jgi:acetyl-CoA carboxylase carboxyl transferase subunit alpha
MMHPEGYRKASRLAIHAGKFSFPILSLVDTPGAYPGARAEEQGIAGAIGKTIMEWFGVPVPVIAVIIGEGGSGGALGMASADRVLMLENAIYSVAMPEAAASIVARDVQQKKAAAESLQITARDVWTMGIVEEIIPEPPGGAHLDHDGAARAVGEAVARHLSELLTLSSDELLDRRYQRFRTIDTLLEDELEFGIPSD